MSDKGLIIACAWIVALAGLIVYAVIRGIQNKRAHDAAIAAAKAPEKKRKSSFQRSMDRAIYRSALDRGYTPIEARKLVKLHNEDRAYK